TDEKIKKEIIKSIEHASKRECEEKLKNFTTDTAPPPKEFILKLTLSEKTKAQYEELKNLLAHRKLDQDAFFEAVFKVAIERFKVLKFHLTNKKETTSRNPRYVTAAMKKAVYERD